MASTTGCTIGPPAARLYAVDPVGVATISPSAFTRVTNSSPTKTERSVIRARAALVIIDVVQRDMVRQRLAGAHRRRPEHHPGFHARRAVERRLERWIEFRESRFREEPEAAEIDTENRHVDVGRAGAVRDREERAVTAEDDKESDIGNQR
jgi:hypothetical protein